MPTGMAPGGMRMRGMPRGMKTPPEFDAPGGGMRCSGGLFTTGAAPKWTLPKRAARWNPWPIGADHATALFDFIA